MQQKHKETAVTTSSSGRNAGDEDRNDSTNVGIGYGDVGQAIQEEEELLFTPQRDAPDDATDLHSTSSTVALLRKMVDEEEEKSNNLSMVGSSEKNRVSGTNGSNKNTDVTASQRNYSHLLDTSSSGLSSTRSHKNFNVVSVESLGWRIQKESSEASAVIADVPNHDGTEPITASATNPDEAKVQDENPTKSFHQYEANIKKLTNENCNLTERLAVAEARASHASEVDTLLQESEGVISNLEKKVEELKDRHNEQMKRFQERGKKEVVQLQEKTDELAMRNKTLEREFQSSVRKMEDTLKQRAEKIQSLESMLRKADRNVVASQAESKVEAKRVRDEYSKEKEDWKRREAEYEAKIKEISESFEQKIEDTLKSTDESFHEQFRIMETQNSSLANRLSQQQQRSQKMEDEMRVLSQRNESLNKENKSLLEELHETKTSLARLESLNKHTEEEKSAIEKNAKDSGKHLRKELSDARNTIEKLEAKLMDEAETKENDLKHMEFLLTERERAIDALEDRRTKQEDAVESLAATVRSYEKKNNMLQKEFDEYKQQMKDMSSNFESTKAKAALFEAEKLELEKKLAEREKQVKQQLSDATKIIADAENEWKRQLDSAEAKAMSLEKERIQEEKEIKVLREKFSKKAQENLERARVIAEQERDMKKLEQAISEATTVNQHMSTDAARLRSKLAQLEEKSLHVDKLEALTAENERVIGQLEEELVQVREQGQQSLQALRLDLQQNTRHVELDFQARVEALEQEKATLRKELTEMSREHKEEIDSREKALASQKESLASYRGEMRRLITSIDGKLKGNRKAKELLQHQNEELEEQLRQSKVEAKRYQDELANHESRVVDQERDLHHLMTDLEKAKASNSSLREQVATLRSRVFKAEDLASRSASMEMILDDLRKEKAEFERAKMTEIEELQCQLNDALNRKKKMEKELTQNTKLLVKIKDKMGKRM